jgi:hypothetical protein
LIERSKQIHEGCIKQLTLTKESIELNKQQFQENLRKLGVSDFSCYEFEGQNFRVIQAKHLKDKWMLNNQATGRRVPQKPLKEITLEKFRFYPPKLASLLEREAYAYKQLINYQPMIEEGDNPQLAMRLYNAEREKIRNAIPLSKTEQDEKNRMLKQGFFNWSVTEYKNLITAMRKHGRSDYANISKRIETKSVEEVTEYLRVFWDRVHEIPDSISLVTSIQDCEDTLKRRNEFENFLHKKLKDVTDPLTEINIIYTQKFDSSAIKFSLDEDKILIWLFYKYKSLYLNADHTKVQNAAMEAKLFERIRDEIRFFPHFRFNWRFLSCDSIMLNNRCKRLIKLIEKEFDSKNKKSQPKTQFITIENDEEDTGIYNFDVIEDDESSTITNQLSDCQIEEDNDAKNDTAVTLDYEEEKASSSSDMSYSSDASADFKGRRNKLTKTKQKTSAAAIKNIKQKSEPQNHKQHQKNASKAKARPDPLFCYVQESDEDLPYL